MFMTSTLFILSLAGAVLAAVVGTLWYSPKTPMGKVHMRYLGFDTLSPEEQARKIEEAKPMMGKMYATQLLLSFITAFAVVFIMATSMQNGVSAQMSFGFVMLNWLCFMVPVIGSALLWSNCERSLAWKKFFADIFANLVTVLLIAYMTTLFI
jgi:hypothetical protein